MVLKESIKFIFRPTRNLPPFSQCKSKLSVQIQGWLILLALGFFCDVPCSSDLLVNSSFFQRRITEQVLALQPLPCRKKGYLPLHPACEADQSSSKVDHDPYGVVRGFRGNCKVFVSLKMAN